MALATIIDRGKYVYRADGARADVDERWLRLRSAEGDLITLSERASGSHRFCVRVRARERGGRVVEVGVRWRSDAPGAAPRCDARYVIGPAAVIAVRRLAGEGEERTEVRAEAAIASPLMRVFMGATIRAVAERGAAPVFVPWLTDPSDAARLLVPHIERRRARRIAEERVETENGVVAATRFEYIGEQYDESARFWVGADGLLARYEWREWDVRLRRER